MRPLTPNNGIPFRRSVRISPCLSWRTCRDSTSLVRMVPGSYKLWYSYSGLLEVRLLVHVFAYKVLRLAGLTCMALMTDELNGLPGKVPGGLDASMERPAPSTPLGSACSCIRSKTTL